MTQLTQQINDTPIGPSVYISKITLNDNQDIQINENDIVVFVGPNNVGKSQALRDIYQICLNNPNNTLLVKEIEIEKKGSLSLKYLQKNCRMNYQGGSNISGNFMGEVFYVQKDDTDAIFKKQKYLGDYRALFVNMMDTDVRLKACNPIDNIEVHGLKTNAIHYIAYDDRFRAWFTNSFRKAFGTGAYPNAYNGTKINLVMGDIEEKILSSKNKMEVIEEIRDEFSRLPTIHNQGDGIRSFVGVLLNLIIEPYRIYMIDEPESFLHPPQAYIMGQLIVEALGNEKQAFISTHSEDLIKGLLKSAPGRVKIIRITRENDANTFSTLDNAKLYDIWKDPLLKYSNIMNGLFHKNVVICESDGDCKFYSLINDELKKNDSMYSETLFLQCGGKHRIAQVSNALRSVGVDVKCIVDIDILDNEKTFHKITDAYGVKWDLISDQYEKIRSNMKSPGENIERSFISNELQKKDAPYISEEEIKSLREALKTPSKWTLLKKEGVDAMDEDVRIPLIEIINIIKESGIYIVSCGELENFIESVGGHGPQWVNNVLETYQNLDGPVFDSIKEFVKSMKI